MANFPEVGSQFQRERLGVNAVAQVSATLGLIWCENQVKDVGIDGQLEYVTPKGNATVGYAGVGLGPNKREYFMRLLRHLRSL